MVSNLTITKEDKNIFVNGENISSLSDKTRKRIVRKYSRYMKPTIVAEIISARNKLETIKEGKDENNSISSVKSSPKSDTIKVHRTNRKDRISNEILADLSKTRRNRYGIRNSIKGFAKYSRKVWNNLSSIISNRENMGEKRKSVEN